MQCKGIIEATLGDDHVAIALFSLALSQMHIRHNGAPCSRTRSDDSALRGVFTFIAHLHVGMLSLPMCGRPVRGEGCGDGSTAPLLPYWPGFDQDRGQ